MQTHDSIAIRPLFVRLALASILVLVPWSRAFAGVNRWTSHGPGGGGGIIVVDPRDPNHLYVGNPAGGSPPVSESRDGGLHWTPASDGLAAAAPYFGVAVRDLLIDPSHPDVLYAVVNQTLVFKSVDGGRSWTRAATPTGRFDLTLVEVMAVDPAHGETLYAHGGFDVWRSNDGGESWLTVNSGLPADSRFWALAVDPRIRGTVYAGGDEGVFKSVDFGEHWFQSSDGLAGRTISSLAIDPRSSEIVFAATDSGIFRTRDGGARWELAGLTGTYSAVVEVDPANGTVVYAGGLDGLFRSLDGGFHWQRLETGGGGAPYVSSIGLGSDSRTVYAHPFSGLVRSSDRGETWTGISDGLPRPSFFALAAPAASDGSDFFAGGVTVFRTRDGGRTWTDPGNAGLASSLTALVADPRTGETLFGSGTGVFRSTNGGASWSRRGLDDLIVYRLALDPRRPDSMYAGILPNTPTAPSGIRRSTNGGASWVDASAGLPSSSFVRDFAFDPSSEGVVFAAVTPQSSAPGRFGVYKSTNAGDSWSLSLEGVVVTVASSAGDPTTLYAGGSGIWRSRDEGATWQHFDLGPYGFVTALAVDPAHPTVVYAVSDNTVVRSMDSGESWRPFNSGLDSTTVNALLVAPSGRGLHAAAAGVFDYTIQSEAVTIPAAASLRGIPPAYFHSDVSVFNASEAEARVVATYRCLGGACPPIEKEFTLPGRQVRLFQDMVATFFLQPDSGGAIEFESAEPLVVTSRLYSPTHPAPTLGMFVPGLRADEAYPKAVLTSLSHSADRSVGFRTNVGVFNSNDLAQNIRFSFLDGDGQPLGEVSRTVPARQALQINDVDLPFPANSMLESFICMVEGDGEAPLYAYAAVIDNQSQDSIFVPGRDAAAPFGDALVLPAAASLHGAGETYFHSDVAILNPGDTGTQLSALYRCAVGTCQNVERTLTLGPGQLASYDDIVDSLFEAPETAGVIDLRTLDGGRVMATSRLFTPSRPEPTVGMFVPALDRFAATRSAVLTSLSRSADSEHGSRTNVGVFNTYSQTVTFRIFSGDGAFLGKVSRLLGDQASVQVNDVFGAAGVWGNVPSAYILVEGDQGGALYAWAAVIDNQSQDPIFVTGQLDPNPPPIP